MKKEIKPSNNSPKHLNPKTLKQNKICRGSLVLVRVRRPRGGPLVPARNRAGTKGLVFSPASGVLISKPGLKALTDRD
jgi:hypothetical protein